MHVCVCESVKEKTLTIVESCKADKEDVLNAGVGLGLGMPSICQASAVKNVNFPQVEFY